MSLVKFFWTKKHQVCNLMLLALGAGMSFQAHAKENHPYKVGIIIGQTTENSSRSNMEKMCIFKSTTNSLQNQYPNVDFIFVENNRSASGSVEAALKLINNDIDIVLLPLLSKEAEAAADFLTPAGIPFVTSATAMNVIKDTQLGFSIMASNLYQAELLAHYYLSQTTREPLHIVRSKSNRYSVEIAGEFLRLVLEKRPDLKVTVHDFSTNSMPKIVEEIQSGDTIFAPLFNPHIALLYHELDLNDKENLSILGPDSVGGRKEFYDIIEKVSPNITLRFLKNWNGETKGPTKELFGSYANTYCSANPNSFLSAYSFDLIKLIESELQQLTKLKSKKQALHVISQSNYLTVMDGQAISINNTGHNRKPMYLFEVSDQGNRWIETLSLRETEHGE
ncbi:ABC transporter substrate-binding protein [Vibrio atypicus]|uniref:ABC transporter substrate-binding protein n=1 Tax=Vibrio atypicus TaxID=558271 RepID=UPI00373508A7